MKRALVCSLLLIAAAGYVLLQTQPPAPKLAAIMPSGALLYLETPDFGRLLRDWDTSKVRADWLTSANYAVFSRSNLFTKLAGVYKEYGAAAGFLPGVKGVAEIAGADSALALYGIHDVEFLYITRIADADLMKSQLWAVRDTFQPREAGGVPFYLRTDIASQRTVAFAFTKGYLLLATRDDLVGQSLELLAGATHPNLASDRWYRDAVAAAGNPGELRLVMNLESLVKGDYFRSYWVQRNVSQIRRYWSGIADLNRTEQAITESRVFLRTPGAEVAPPADGAVSGLLALVPPEAGLYKASRIVDSSSAAALIVQKLIAPSPQSTRDERYAPPEASPDNTAGAESDLETRIDEQPLPAGAGVADSVAAVRTLTDKAAGQSLLLVQLSAPVSGTFIHTPAVIVLSGAQDWDRNLVAGALSTAAGKLWTTSQLGAAWVSDTTGRDPSERLDGLGTLAFAIRGRLLILGNDLPLLAAVLGRTAASLPAANLTYAAGFRHLRERSDFERIMTALDFTSAALPSEGGEPQAPPFFSGNMASLSQALSRIAEVRVTQEERGAVTLETVTYPLRQ
ncbi:MAG: hypothetical protein ACLP59_35425 [Bryobacteraceae bacterium]